MIITVMHNSFNPLQPNISMLTHHTVLFAVAINGTDKKIILTDFDP